MRDLTKGNIYKTFLIFAIPLILSGLLSTAYNLIDTVIAGKYLGASGLAAIGSTAAFAELISSVLWGYSSGFSIYIAKLFGEKNYSQIRSSVINNYIFILIVSFLIGIISVIFHNIIFDFLKIDSSIRNETKQYFIIYAIGLGIIVLNNTGVHIMNSLGSSGFPFAMSILSAILNIGGNIFTVTVLKLGVRGIALATVFSAAVVDVFYIIKLKKYFREMGVCNEKIQFSPKIISESLGLAVPVTLQQMIMYISSLLVSPFINAIGSSATAAYTVILKIYSVNANIYQNSAKTVTTYSAQCIGRRKTDKLKKGLRVGFIQGIVFLAPVLILCVLFSRQICMLFFPKGYTGISLTYSEIYLRFYLPFITINMINNLFHAFYRGVMAMKYLIAATFSGAFARVISTMLLAPALGIEGVYLGWVISWVAEAIITVIIYISGKWKDGIVNKIEMKEGSKV